MFTEEVYLLTGSESELDRVLDAFVVRESGLQSRAAKLSWLARYVATEEEKGCSHKEIALKIVPS